MDEENKKAADKCEGNDACAILKRMLAGGYSEGDLEHLEST